MIKNLRCLFVVRSPSTKNFRHQPPQQVRITLFADEKSHSTLLVPFSQAKFFPYGNAVYLAKVFQLLAMLFLFPRQNKRKSLFMRLKGEQDDPEL